MWENPLSALIILLPTSILTGSVKEALSTVRVDTPSLPSKFAPYEYSSPSVVKKEMCFSDAQIDDIA